MEVSETEAAYAAGLIDGEGCIGIYTDNKRKTPSIRVGCTNTVRESLEFLCNKFGGAISSPRLRLNRKPHFEWVVYGLKALPLLRAILPFSIIKKEKIQQVLVLLENRLQSKKSKAVTAVH